MITINSKADLNRAVAEAAFCSEPPMSERRAIHESGAWGWVAGAADPLCIICARNRPYFVCQSCADAISKGHWEPADFCGDPLASYRLRQKMRKLGYYVEILNRLDGSTWCWIHRDENAESEENPRQVAATSEWSECGAVAVESIRALGVEFELIEGWDQR